MIFATSLGRNARRDERLKLSGDELKVYLAALPSLDRQGARLENAIAGYCEAAKILMTPGGELSARGRNVIAHTPMKRFGEAPELGGCVRWLLDDAEAGFVTGQTIFR